MWFQWAKTAGPKTNATALPSYPSYPQQHAHSAGAFSEGTIASSSAAAAIGGDNIGAKDLHAVPLQPMILALPGANLNAMVDQAALPTAEMSSQTAFSLGTHGGVTNSTAGQGGSSVTPPGYLMQKNTQAHSRQGEGNMTPQATTSTTAGADSGSSKDTIEQLLAGIMLPQPGPTGPGSTTEPLSRQTTCSRGSATGGLAPGGEVASGSQPLVKLGSPQRAGAAPGTSAAAVGAGSSVGGLYVGSPIAASVGGTAYIPLVPGSRAYVAAPTGHTAAAPGSGRTSSAGQVTPPSLQAGALQDTSGSLTHVGTPSLWIMPTAPAHAQHPAAAGGAGMATTQAAGLPAVDALTANPPNPITTIYSPTSLQLSSPHPGGMPAATAAIASASTSHILHSTPSAANSSCVGPHIHPNHSTLTQPTAADFNAAGMQQFMQLPQRHTLVSKAEDLKRAAAPVPGWSPAGVQPAQVNANGAPTLSLAPQLLDGSAAGGVAAALGDTSHHSGLYPYTDTSTHSMTGGGNCTTTDNNLMTPTSLITTLDSTTGEGTFPSASLYSPHVGTLYEAGQQGQPGLVPSQASLSGQPAPAEQHARLKSHLQALSEAAPLRDKHLLVTRDYLTLPGIHLISHTLATVRCIRVVTLTRCGMRDPLAVELAIALKQGYHDTWVVDLRHNRIGDTGASALADCLGVCGELRDLVLSHNCIGDEGVQALADALTSSTPGPKRVRIANNSAGPDALKDLAAAQKQNTRRHTRPTSRRPPPFILSTAAPTPLTAGLPGAPVQAPGQQQLGWGQQQPASGGKPAVAGGTARAAAGNTCPQPSPGDKSSVEGFFPGVLDCLSASEAEEEGRGGHAAPAWTQNSSTAGQQATEPSCSVLGQQRQQQVVPGVGSSLLHTPPSGALVPQSSSGRASFRQQQVLQQQDEDVRQLCALIRLLVQPVTPEERQAQGDVAQVWNMYMSSAPGVHSASASAAAAFLATQSEDPSYSGITKDMHVGRPLALLHAATVDVKTLSAAFQGVDPADPATVSACLADEQPGTQHGFVPAARSQSLSAEPAQPGLGTPGSATGHGPQHTWSTAPHLGTSHTLAHSLRSGMRIAAPAARSISLPVQQADHSPVMDVESLAEALLCMGHDVQRAGNGWDRHASLPSSQVSAVDCLQNLRHKFLIVTVLTGPDGEVIVMPKEGGDGESVSGACVTASGNMWGDLASSASVSGAHVQSAPTPWATSMGRSQTSAAGRQQPPLLSSGGFQGAAAEQALGTGSRFVGGFSIGRQHAGHNAQLPLVSSLQQPSPVTPPPPAMLSMLGSMYSQDSCGFSGAPTSIHSFLPPVSADALHTRNPPRLDCAPDASDSPVTPVAVVSDAALTSFGDLVGASVVSGSTIQPAGEPPFAPAGPATLLQQHLALINQALSSGKLTPAQQQQHLSEKRALMAAMASAQRQAPSSSRGILSTSSISSALSPSKPRRRSHFFCSQSRVGPANTSRGHSGMPMLKEGSRFDAEPVPGRQVIQALPFGHQPGASAAQASIDASGALLLTSQGSMAILPGDMGHDLENVAAAGVTAARVIVDPAFKEQFELGNNASERYKAILDALPSVFVGLEDRLPLLVELLCEEVSLAFKETGLPVPPWRRATAILSKYKTRLPSMVSSVASVSSSIASFSLAPQHVQQARH